MLQRGTMLTEMEELGLQQGPLKGMGSSTVTGSDKMAVGPPLFPTSWPVYVAMVDVPAEFVTMSVTT
jgi:hypothetical protein